MILEAAEHFVVQNSKMLSYRDEAVCHEFQLLETITYTIQIIILLAVLYGCETWSLSLREEHRLTVFEIRALRRIS
jgi:hypothetical protein